MAGSSGEGNPGGGPGGGTGGAGGSAGFNNFGTPGGFGGGGGGGDGMGGGGGFGGGSGGDGRTYFTGIPPEPVFAGGGGGGGGMGGGLFANGGTLTLINDTFMANTAQGGFGGGMGGNGDGYGGAVFLRNATLTADFDTFSSNSAAQGGSDVYVLSDGSGKQASAALVDDILGQTANAVSDFVADSINSGTAPDLSGSSNDLVRNNPTSGGLPTAAVVSSADPLLAPLGNYGGSIDTFALLPGSPALDAGIPVSGVTTDERGVSRPQGSAPDLGAFQSQGFTLTVTSGNNQSTLVNTAFPNALVVTVTANDSDEPVVGGQVTFTAPGSGASATFSTTNPATIGSNGTASVNATANGTAGSYQVSADTKGASVSVAFALTNLQSTPTVSVTDAGGTYTGNFFAASATAVGVDGTTPVSGSFTFTYHSGSTASGTELPDPPINTGTYTVVATFTSSDPNYSNGTAQTTFTINAATPTVSVTDAGGTYTGKPFPAKATAVGVDGMTPVDGSFTFTYYAGMGTSGTNLGVTAPSNAGTYTVVANFTSTDSNYSNGSAQTTFTIKSASTTTTASHATATFGATSVTLSAIVTSGGGGVPEGTVTFTLRNGTTPIGTATSTSSFDSQGNASVSYALPAGLAASSYTIAADYSDSAGNFVASSDTTHTLTVAPAAASIQFTSIAIAPDLHSHKRSETETITVHVSSPSGTVTHGTVTFTVDGQSVKASVDAHGDASVTLSVPRKTTTTSQSITASFSGPSLLSDTVTQIARWTTFNRGLSSVATFAADGSQSVQSFLHGQPWLDFLYTPSGRLEKVVFGSGLLSWDFSYFDELTVVTLDGVLPVEAMVNTPQGPLMAPLSS